MLFGLDGVELSLVIVFGTLFMAILSGYPVAFALSGSAIISFVLIAIGSELGWLLVEYEGELKPLLAAHHEIFDGPAWQKGLDTLAQWSNNNYSRAFGENQNDTLLAVPLFVLMGIALERSKIAEELLTSMGRLFGGMPGGLAVSVVLVGALLAASTGIVGATVVTMGLISLPTMLRAGYSKELSTGVIATSGTLGQIIPPSIVLVLLGSMVGDIYSSAQKGRSQDLGIPLPELLGDDIAISTGTLFKAAFIPGIVLALLYAAYALGYALLRPHAAPPIKQNPDANTYDLLGDYGRSAGRAAGAIALPSLGFIAVWVIAAFVGYVGSQKPPQDVLEFANAQALLEEIERARASDIDAGDWADLQEFTALVSRAKPIPQDLQTRVDVLLDGTDGSVITATLREIEFTERKSTLLRGIDRFASSIDAMLGPDLAAPYFEVLQRAEGANTLPELTAAVKGAPRGQTVQKLVNRADKEFDFTPYKLVAEDYASAVSKARRKSVIRKFKDDPEGTVEELERRSVLLGEKIAALQALYERFFEPEVNAAFADNLAIIQSATDLETQLNAIRELPASGDLDRAVSSVDGLLKRESYLASSFSYDRAIRQVADGQVPFAVSKPVTSEAANLLRKAFPDMGNGDAPKQLSAYFRDSLDNYVVPAISMGVAAFLTLVSVSFALAASLRRRASQTPILVGALGVLSFVAVAIWLVDPSTSPWTRTALYFIPTALIIYGMVGAVPRLLEVEVIRVVVPPVVLIVAVLGSIFGGITNPTPAAALGAGGAILLSAIKLLERDVQVGPFDNKIGRNILLWTAASIAVMLLVKANFLDGNQAVGFGKATASGIASALYVISILGMIYAVIVLLGARVEGGRPVANPRTIAGATKSFLFSKDRVLSSILMETAKVSIMVFAILIGSQLLALTLRSFGGEEYIEHFLRSFEDPRTLLLVVMVVLFVLGFVLDFIEIIFIVIPIVGPVIYGADPNIMHPAWITILIAVNLQTSFITPPFGFALFYLRGVAPPEIQTSNIYRGIIPFVIIQVVGLTILWFFPQITTFLPDLLPDN